nr:hypothetical protein Iba_chr02dCG10580 [Ipomoea batatas]
MKRRRCHLVFLDADDERDGNQRMKRRRCHLVFVAERNCKCRGGGDVVAKATVVAGSVGCSCGGCREMPRSSDHARLRMSFKNELFSSATTQSKAGDFDWKMSKISDLEERL